MFIRSQSLNVNVGGSYSLSLRYCGGMASVLIDRSEERILDFGRDRILDFGSFDFGRENQSGFRFRKRELSVGETFQ